VIQQDDLPPTLPSPWPERVPRSAACWVVSFQIPAILRVAASVSASLVAGGLCMGGVKLVLWSCLSEADQEGTKAHVLWRTRMSIDRMWYHIVSGAEKCRTRTAAQWTSGVVVNSIESPAIL
jgi:hypothetical protein